MQRVTIWLLSFGGGQLLVACDDGPDPGDPDAFVELPPPDAAVDAIASYDPFTVIDDEPASIETWADPYRSVRVRVWNTKTDDGRRTNVSPEEAEAAVFFLNAGLEQCAPNHPMGVAYQSLGTLATPDKCFVLQTEYPTGFGGARDIVTECTCLRFFFGSRCETSGPLFVEIGQIGDRINELPLVDRDDVVEAHEPGEIDLIFVSYFDWAEGAEILGLAYDNPSRTVLLSEEKLRTDPDYLLTVAHELGHAFGGYPSGAPDYDGHHVDPESALCEGDDDERHIMCGDGVEPGGVIDPLTCAHWYDTIESKWGPRNYTEHCDDLDNDLDEATDENLDCE